MIDANVARTKIYNILDSNSKFILKAKQEIDFAIEQCYTNTLFAWNKKDILDCELEYLRSLNYKVFITTNSIQISW